MSNDHHNNGHNENKPVAFTAPLILGAITVFIILLFVSLGNPCHGCCEDENECAEKQECSKECMEACMKGDHSKHPAGMEHCSMDMKGCGECDGCKAGKECSHHEQGCGECEGCKAGKECSHHEGHAAATDSTETPTDAADHKEPVKEEGHH